MEQLIALAIITATLTFTVLLIEYIVVPTALYIQERNRQHDPILPKTRAQIRKIVPNIHIPTPTQIQKAAQQRARNHPTKQTTNGTP